MKGTLTPWSVFVVATSVGGPAGLYGWRSNFVGSVERYSHVYVAGLLHAASTAPASHFHGCSWGPANSGPPFGWSVIVRRALEPSGRTASISLAPSCKP